MFERCRHMLLLGVLAIAAQASGLPETKPLMDPTEPITAREHSALDQDEAKTVVRGDFRLGSVLIRPSARYAVLNGERVTIGDRVANARVIGIEADRVILEQQGELWQVYLHSRSIKSPARQKVAR